MAFLRSLLLATLVALASAQVKEQRAVERTVAHSTLARPLIAKPLDAAAQPLLISEQPSADAYMSLIHASANVACGDNSDLSSCKAESGCQWCICKARPCAGEQQAEAWRRSLPAEQAVPSVCVTDAQAKKLPASVFSCS
jgi:hypothetical protein